MTKKKMAKSIRQAMAESTVGKKIASSFYVHRSAIPLLPKKLKTLIDRAERHLGHEEGNVIKITATVNDVKVSFLTYMGFHELPHPHLVKNIVVFLSRAPVKTYSQDYWDRNNRYILHRKELLVGPRYPDRKKFAALTKAEEEAGLLGHPNIGYEEDWEALLEKKGLKIVGYKLKCR